MDVSASILRPADPSDPTTTRQDVAQRGILHLLQHLEKWHEFEPICMVSMSSTCQVGLGAGLCTHVCLHECVFVRTASIRGHSKHVPPVVRVLSGARALQSESNCQSQRAAHQPLWHACRGHCVCVAGAREGMQPARAPIRQRCQGQPGRFGRGWRSQFAGNAPARDHDPAASTLRRHAHHCNGLRGMQPISPHVRIHANHAACCAVLSPTVTKHAHAAAKPAGNARA